MKFSDAISEIKNRVSIVDVIGEYVKLKRSGSNYIGLCPFHNEDTPSFVVNEARQIYHCFGQCNKGGNVYTFLQDYLHISFREAVIMLAKRINLDIEDDFSSNDNYKRNEDKKKKLYELHRDVANVYYKILYSDKGKAGLDYLRSRKLTDETIKKFGLGFAPNEFGYVYNLMKEKGYDDTLLFESKLFRLYNDKPCDTFYNRVVFPLVDIYKHVVGFQSRTLEPKPKERKYVNSDDSPIFHKKSFLYAMNYAYFTKQNYYILCEGNMDAITIHQSGFDNAIATMGTAFNVNQMYLIKRKPKKVYLCQDTDEAGINAIINSDKILKSESIETYVLDLKPSKDVDEFINTYGIDAFKKKLSSPIPTFLFIVSSLKRKYNINDPYEQDKYINEIISLLASIQNSFVRDNYLTKVSIQENLDAGTLHNLLEKHLKGNSLQINNSFKQQNNNDTENIDSNNKLEVSKLDSNFIYFIFLLPKYKDKIKNIIDKSELANDTYAYIYSLYLDGVDFSDIYIKIEELEEEKKDYIKRILSYNNNNDDETETKLIENLNYIIRQIKIRNENNKTDNNLNNIYEKNKKIMEINKTKYI